ncbi:SubName: Full=Uncharacterized protein {ECO:0000313/EMBL:CCA74803.1} [Serendipita indica DSM 11827]|uniref:INO80 complex subunit B-like conserved region domain-containing protein n=1 Tax=Serendipita indica (strain DSM 11827) TaxID=1109443 RepID=G4TU10_SERID|nr:SubName: Full=Uncharacterized protein {ECO:0000313/EMBL:CCA74803.1} [Serendipita indica DSM 11827]CCA74803.1 hypothetical protein PIIN_08772 [Serendipita indica DSM 11827]
MPPRVPPAKRYTRRIIEDEESDELPEDEQYDEDEEEQMDDMDEDEDDVDELDEDEDDYAYETPKKTGLKIKLNVSAPKGKSGGTTVSTPGETPPYAMPRKRGRKSRVIAASDDEAEEQEEEEDAEADFVASVPTAQPTRMTARQAALAGGGGPVEHVSLEEPPNPRKRKWTEEEIAMRREEAARKRKLKGAQRQEDEKQMIINRLINKGSGGKRGRWANKQAAKEKEKEPTPEGEDAGEDEGEPTGAAGEGTEAGEGNETTSGAEEEEENGPTTGAGAPQRPATRGRGGWRGRGRRGRGARLPPPPVKMHIPYMRWISGMRDIVVEDDSLKPGTEPSTTAGTVDESGSAEERPVPKEKEPYISLSIPTELLAATSISDPEPPLPAKAASTCAVQGCNQARKYKLVGSPDPEVGACGMAHLTTLQNSVSVS